MHLGNHLRVLKDVEHLLESCIRCKQNEVDLVIFKANDSQRVLMKDKVGQRIVRVTPSLDYDRVPNKLVIVTMRKF